MSVREGGGVMCGGEYFGLWRVWQARRPWKRGAVGRPAVAHPSIELCHPFSHGSRCEKWDRKEKTTSALPLMCSTV